MFVFFFFFKQKTAYEIQGDWSSDVCSSDLLPARIRRDEATQPEGGRKRVGPRRHTRAAKPRSFAFSRACVRDRKSTRLNSSHLVISYAVFCLKKKKSVNHSVL